MKISGWGNYPVIDAQVIRARNLEQLSAFIKNKPHGIVRGLGRSYGDSALAPEIISTDALKRILAFDEKRGILTAESGISLAEIISIFLPRGWFLPVTPGTKYVTLGGAIASDVHGKNHHKEGSFSEHLLGLDLANTQGRSIHVSPQKNRSLFLATCGGMGLTGAIQNATFRMKKVSSPFIKQRSIRAGNLDRIMDLFAENKDYTYSVAWLDGLARGKSLGRSILFVGEHEESQSLPLTVKKQREILQNKKEPLSIPFYLPSFTVNRLDMKVFNQLYYTSFALKSSEGLVHLDKFFYPLDGIGNWNRMYGKNGFTQYQFVLPLSESKRGLWEILSFIERENMPAFFCVLKLFGKGNQNHLSFPMEGFTLAVDFPLSPKLFAQLDKLDSIVMHHGGRLYLAKDVRMKKNVFEKGYPKLKDFLQVKKKVDRGNFFQSLQSLRLGVQ